LRVWAIAFATAFLLAWVSSASAAAATLNVNTTTDESTSGDHRCSLREAIAAANSPGTRSDCGTASSVSNTIVLGAGTYTLSIAPAGADDNATGDLNVSGAPLTIVGVGANASVIDATGLGDRALSVAAGATLTLEGLAVTGGHAPDGAAGVNGTSGTRGGPGGAGSTGADGGGILNLGSLTLTQVAVTNNRAGDGGSGGAGGSAFILGAGGGNGGAGGLGGGIYTTGKLTLNDVAMSGNGAGQGGAGGRGGAAKSGFANQGFFGGGGGIGGAGGGGGGVYNAGSAATLTVTDSTISGNAGGTGGSGGSGGGAIGMCGCDPGFGGGGGAGGSGGADGGGVADSMGTIVVSRSTLFSNVAGYGGSGGVGAPGSGVRGRPGPGGAGGLGSAGGGISSDGSLSATNSTLYNNSAGGGGAGGTGPYGRGPGGSGGNGGDGGAIAVANGASSLLNVTVDGNQGSSGGGSTGGSSGVEGLGGGIYVQSAISSNDMVLQNTIVAQSARGANCAASSALAITDAGHNLSFPDTTCPGINGDPKLLSFGNYGGPTDTLALASGSAAIDQVPATGAGCPSTDQRGVKRPQGSACDIGAFEFATPQITITSPTTDASETIGSTVLAANQCSARRDHERDRDRQGTGANGQPIETSSTGTKHFTVTATEKADNRTPTTVQVHGHGQAIAVCQANLSASNTTEGRLGGTTARATGTVWSPNLLGALGQRRIAPGSAKSEARVPIEMQVQRMR
jgi:CSLREA domain-containing protein